MAVSALSVGLLIQPAVLEFFVLAERVTALILRFFRDVAATGGFISGPFWRGGALLYEDEAAAC